MVVPLRVGLLGLAPALAACGDDLGPIACTEEARPGIIISAVSAANGNPVTEGLEGDIEDGDFTSGLAVLAGDNRLFGATERAGTYTVRVRATGFQEVTITDIEVRADECHVITEERTALLPPA